MHHVIVKRFAGLLALLLIAAVLVFALISRHRYDCSIVPAYNRFFKVH